MTECVEYLNHNSDIFVALYSSRWWNIMKEVVRGVNMVDVWQILQDVKKTVVKGRKCSDDYE